MVDNCLLCESVKLGRDMNLPIRMGAGLVENFTLCESVKLGRDMGSAIRMGAGVVDNSPLCKSVKLGWGRGLANTDGGWFHQKLHTLRKHQVGAGT